ncbi:efflux RND transporter permease subunit [Hoeflea sp.]|uniref:efflux RND transporter permease subunit n=1 Tax=Hoeflea sp. TaxID=1940281 RepID=UPI003B51D86D
MNNRNLGLGLERLGLWAMNWPRLSGLIVLVGLVFAGAQFSSLKFDGDVRAVLDTQSAAYAEYAEHRSLFHDDSRDVALLVHVSPDQNPADAIGRLRELHLELSQSSGIESVRSPFSNAQLRSANPVVPDGVGIERLFGAMLEAYPALGAFVSPATGSLIYLVRLEDEAYRTNAGLEQRLRQLEQTAAGTLGEAAEIEVTGRPVLRVEIARSIVENLALLLGVGIVMAFLVSAFVFGSAGPALVCTLPPITCIVLTLGVFGFTNVPVTYLTVIVPVLALVICSADTIVLVYKAMSSSDPVMGAETFSRAVRTVGPASSLTSVTTALAFASFVFAGNAAISELAVFGALGVCIAFVSMMLALPAVVHFCPGMMKPFARSGARRLVRIGDLMADRAPMGRRVFMIVLGAVFAVLFWGHFALEPSYSVRDYVPRGSGVLAAEEMLDRDFGGSARLHVVLDASESPNPFNPAKLEQLAGLASVVSGVLEENGIRSQPLPLAGLQTGTGLQSLASLTAGDLQDQIVARDNSAIRISVGASSLQSTAVTVRVVEALEQAVASLPFASSVRVTGFNVVLSDNFPALLDQMRVSLFICVALVFMILWAVTRRLALAAACVMPNLLSVLVVENMIRALGLDLNLTNLIGLTIAFGISVDNSIHVVNALLSAGGGKGTNETGRPVVRQTIRTIAPALMAGTLILCVSTGAMAVSTIPAIAQLGMLMAASLLIALVSNLTVLPASLLAFGAVKG